MRCYATLPKKAAGRFTSNKLINQPIEGHLKDVQKTLVYIGKDQIQKIQFINDESNFFGSNMQ
jgi:hypothetical protein